MNNKMKQLLLILLAGTILTSAITTPSEAQYRRVVKPGWGYGAGIIYNFHVEGFGAEARIKIPLIRNLSLVPEFSYFPGFNEYHEYYAGGALHYELLNLGSYNFYVAAGGYYNNWLNYDEFTPDNRNKTNFVFEAGGGLVRNHGCIRPFIEDRYDFKWKENSLRIGIYIYPRSCNGSGGKEKCPGVGT
jgi:hypothetical protein